jgi:membrane-associated phospholipid phosphatase
VSRNVLRAAIAVSGPVAFVQMARRASLCKVSTGEERVFRAINRLSPALRTPVWFAMQPGSLAAVPVAAVAALSRSRPTAIALAVDGTAVWAGCKVVKRVVKRGRPADCLDGVVICGEVQHGRGFPSGHAAVATTLTAIGSRLLPSPASHVIWMVPLLVGFGRQFVGAHLPLDVVGGFALGLTVGAATNLVLDAR